MIFIYMILIALLPTVKGLMPCDISKPAKAQQCVGALGGPLVFDLPTTATKTILKKNHTIILHIANNKILHSDEKKQGLFTIFTNGTLKLNNVKKNHSGDYLWEVYHSSSGKLSYNLTMHLEIQAPVSEPAVSQICLSPEQMEVTCSSEGDVKEFNLSLDGYLLIQTKAHCQTLSHLTEGTLLNPTEQDTPNVSNVSISLYGQLTGNVVCSVENNVSKQRTVIQLTSCKASITDWLYVTVIASVSTPLLLLALFFGIKHLQKKTRLVSVTEGNAEDETVYSAVVVKNRRHNRHNLDPSAA